MGSSQGQSLMFQIVSVLHMDTFHSFKSLLWRPLPVFFSILNITWSIDCRQWLIFLCQFCTFLDFILVNLKLIKRVNSLRISSLCNKIQCYLKVFVRGLSKRPSRFRLR